MPDTIEELKKLITSHLKKDFQKKDFQKQKKKNAKESKNLKRRKTSTGKSINSGPKVR